MLGHLAAKPLAKQAAGRAGWKAQRGSLGEGTVLGPTPRGAPQGCAGLAQHEGTQGLRGGLGKKRNKKAPMQ